MIPWLRFFARPEIKSVARAIAATRPCDWEFGPHTSYSPSLDIEVWRANRGYGFEVWLGRTRGELGSGSATEKLCSGGPDGECAWHAYKRIERRARQEAIRKHTSRHVAAHPEPPSSP